MTTDADVTKDAKKCRFNDCDNMAVDGTTKCAFHKNRRQCCVPNCTNQVYARKLCVRHGGKKQCQADNCEAHARGGGFCLQHGGFVVKRFCIVEGCSKQAHARQKCVRHGGGRRCKVENCVQHARAGGLCNRHSHGHECRVEGCGKTAQHSGNICFRHAMELRAHGEAVPELNISKGGRLSSKKREELQKQQMWKQEQFHHAQLLQQNQPPSSSAPNSQTGNPGGPFGLPLKINVPTQNAPQMPQKVSIRTPLGTNGFPTPRSHDFSLLMGLPSPQIDNSQLPSVLAMTNQSGVNTSTAQTPTSFMNSILANGPPSFSRSTSKGNSNYLALGVTPTGNSLVSTPNMFSYQQGAGGDVSEDLEAFLNSNNGYKYPGTGHTPSTLGNGGVSPIAYGNGGYQLPTPIMENNYDQNGYMRQMNQYNQASPGLQNRLKLEIMPQASGSNETSVQSSEGASGQGLDKEAETKAPPMNAEVTAA